MIAPVTLCGRFRHRLDRMPFAATFVAGRARCHSNPESRSHQSCYASRCSRTTSSTGDPGNDVRTSGARCRASGWNGLDAGYVASSAGDLSTPGMLAHQAGP
jgi:hypothetical protein